MFNESFSRREFLATSMAAASAGLIGCSQTSSTMSLGKIGIQLYTVRDQIARDIKGTLGRISTIGFEGVETAFWPEGVSIQQAAQLLNEVGLKVFSAHCEIPVGDYRKTALEMARAYNCKRLVWHGWPEDQRYKTTEGIKSLATLYNDANKFCLDNNLQFGIHNHWWEFHNRVDGRFAYEILLDHLDPEVFFELDTYWLKSAGHDPAKIVGAFGKRAPLLHIKDGPAPYNDNLAEDETPMVPVGSGSQDFPSIVKSSNGNTEWMIVEMDRTAGDVFAAITQSYDYLVSNKLASGKNPPSQV